MSSMREGVLWKFVICYLCTVGKAAEPRCSPFHYEEALLEKMVRLEFKVEQMADGFKVIEGKVAKELEKMRNDRDDLGRRQTKAKAEELEKMRSLVEENLLQNEAKLSRMSMDLMTHQNETLHKLKEGLKTPSTFFRARKVFDYSPGQNQRLVFSTVLEARGGGYNKATGIFTAPLAGMYLFTMQLCNEEDMEINVAFVQDDVVKHLVQLEEHGWSCGTSSLVTAMEAGSRVWIKSSTAYTDVRLYADHLRWNVFSGVRLN